MTKRILFRPIRGSLNKAMEEAISISCLEEIRNFYGDGIFELKGKLTTEFYCFDGRINWETWLVLDGDGHAVGYTNAQVE